MSDHDFSQGFKACLCVTGLALIAEAAIIFPLGINMERKDAIKAGVAHWEADPTNGQTKFVYDTPKEIKP